MENGKVKWETICQNIQDQTNILVIDYIRLRYQKYINLLAMGIWKMIMGKLAGYELHVTTH